MTVNKELVKVPYGVGDYARLRSEGNYYIDKTLYIERLEKYTAPVFLRPRRFGKSLMCSTLYYYYARQEGYRFQELFGDTYIGQHPTPHHNTKLVVRYNFSVMQMSDDMDELEQNFNEIFAKCTDNCVINNRDLFGADFQLHATSAQKRLEELIQHVKDNKLPQLYIIIDEYDNFTNQLISGCKDELYEQLTTKDSFLRNFFKVIKKGCDEGTIFTSYVTGVLPVTIDDLTSGYNIATVLTLDQEFYSMMGFTHDELRPYLQKVLNSWEKPEMFGEMWKLLIDNYDSYRFAVDGQMLFNSTIVTYFLKYLSIHGTAPRELLDINLRTDVNWIRRLARTQERADDIVNSLLLGDGMDYMEKDLTATFNLQRFLDPAFFSISLFFLGMVTIKDDFTMVLPNLCMKGLFMGYYNDINQIKQPAYRYTKYFRQYSQDRRLEPLIESICREYLGDLPAQVFDKVNENFVRCAVFNTLKDYLMDYTYSLEVNNPAGRSDLEMTGRTGSKYENDVRIIEFKYFHASEEKKMLSITEPPKGAVEQVHSYIPSIKRDFPQRHVRCYVILVCANKHTRMWEV